MLASIVIHMLHDGITEMHFLLIFFRHNAAHEFIFLYSLFSLLKCFERYGRRPIFRTRR